MWLLSSYYFKMTASPSFSLLVSPYNGSEKPSTGSPLLLHSGVVVQNMPSCQESSPRQAPVASIQFMNSRSQNSYLQFCIEYHALNIRVHMFPHPTKRSQERLVCPVCNTRTPLGGFLISGRHWPMCPTCFGLGFRFRRSHSGNPGEACGSESVV